MRNIVVKIIQYSISTAIIVALFLVNAFNKNLFSTDDTKVCMGIISDGFLISGVVLCLSGLLTWIGKIGFFDMMGYGFYSIRVLFTPSKSTFSNRVNYYDYKTIKESKPRVWYPFLCISGGISILISIIFLIIYCCM